MQAAPPHWPVEVHTPPSLGPASHTPWMIASRGTTTGPTRRPSASAANRSRKSKSDGPHSPPGQSRSLLQLSPTRVPAVHVVIGAHAVPPQSVEFVHGSP